MERQERPGQSRRAFSFWAEFDSQNGATAGKFMAEVKKYLENWSEDIG